MTLIALGVIAAAAAATGVAFGVRRLGSLLASVLVGACVLLAAVPLTGQITGKWRLVPVLSGSMEPSLERGDLAWVSPRPTSSLRPGDVVVFNAPLDTGRATRRVIHRVVEVVDPSRIDEADRQADATFIRTKGDANEDDDPWVAAITDEQVWVKTSAVRAIGRPLLAAGSLHLRFALTLLLAFLIGAAGVRTLLAPDESAPAAAGRHRLPPPGRGWSRRALTFGAGAALAGLSAGAAALLTDAEATRTSGSSGAVALDANGSTLGVSFGTLLPGDAYERIADLRNAGSLRLGRLQLVVTGPGSLATDQSGGLQLAVERCSVPFVGGVGAEGLASYACGGTLTTIVADRPAVGRSELDLAALGVDDPGGLDHVRFVVRLPDTAPSSLSGSSTDLRIRLVALQRPAVIR